MTSRAKRRALANKALSLDPDCADALVLLAEQAMHANEAMDLYERAMRAGERKLGEEFFEENRGHFWGIFETRGYMRARFGYARWA